MIHGDARLESNQEHPTSKRAGLLAGKPALVGDKQVLAQGQLLGDRCPGSCSRDGVLAGCGGAWGGERGGAGYSLDGWRGVGGGKRGGGGR